MRIHGIVHARNRLPASEKARATHAQVVSYAIRSESFMLRTGCPPARKLATHMPNMQYTCASLLALILARRNIFPVVQTGGRVASVRQINTGCGRKTQARFEKSWAPKKKTKKLWHPEGFSELTSCILNLT